MKNMELKGWNYIVYTLVKNNFQYKEFSLKDIYAFENNFQKVYPNNFHIRDKLRQILQNLRDKNLLIFKSRGIYQLLNIGNNSENILKQEQELVYLLSNDSMPGWVKIGRTNSIKERLKALYNTSVPLPFKLEDQIFANSYESSLTIERSIHSIIDTLNPDLRKNTHAKRREFFKLSPEEGKNIFNLVNSIVGINKE